MADYLTDDEQAERLKRWWDQNGTFLILGLIIAVGLVIGWRYYQDYRSDRASTASSAFQAYLDARANDEAVDEHLAIIDDEFPGSSYHVFSLLYRAADQGEEEDWEEALAYLERAVELADEGSLRDIARYRVAKVLYQLDRLDESAAALAEVASSGLKPQVAELSGDLAVARGDLAAAGEAYRTAIEASRSDEGDATPGLALMELKLASLVDSEQ